MALSIVLLGACSSGQVAAPDNAAPDNATPNDNAAVADDTADDAATDEAVPGEGAGENPPAPSDPEFFTGLTGQLVLRDDDGNIVVSNPDGSEPIVLSEPGADHSQPTWSSNSDRVAWSSFGPNGATLNIAAADGTEQVQIPAPAPAFYLSWSPEDSWIAGLRPNGAGMETFVTDLSEQTEEVVSGSQPFYFDWQDDDNIVAAIRNEFLVDIAANGEVPPASRFLSQPFGVFQAPAILPNGDVLAALLDASGNNLTRLTDCVGSLIATAQGPMFISATPDGSRVAVLVPTNDAQDAESEVIAFQFDEEIELELGRVTIIDLESGDVETLSQRGVVAMSWSPDSSVLALLGSNQNGFGLQWSFETDSGTLLGDTFAPSNRLAQRYLPFFDQYNLSSTWWSPDSNAIVFSGETAGETGVFVDRVFDDAAAQKVSEGDIAFWSPAQ